MDAPADMQIPSTIHNMELIYPEFLRFMDRVAVPYTAYMPRYTVSSSGADCKSAVIDSGGATPSLGTNMHDCWNWKTGMTKDHVSQGVWVRVPNCALTPDQGRTRENKEPSSHGHISPASVGRVSGYVRAYPVSPASLRERTVGYGPTDRRSNRLLETYMPL